MKLNPISSMSTTMNPEFSVRQPVHTSLNLSRTMALVCLTAFALAGAAYAQTSAATPAPAMPADHGSHAGHAAHMGHSAADSASDKAAAPSADAAQVMTDGEVSLDASLRMIADVPSDRLLVTESGIATRDDVKKMRDHGVNAFLVGETFMRAPEPGEALAQLFA